MRSEANKLSDWLFFCGAAFEVVATGLLSCGLFYL
jgi:hypothetical protein